MSSQGYTIRRDSNGQKVHRADGTPVWSKDEPCAPGQIEARPLAPGVAAIRDDRGREGVVGDDGMVEYRGGGVVCLRADGSEYNPFVPPYGSAAAVDFVAIAAATGSSALTLAADALRHADQRCPYHGADFERAGMWADLPRCDSCKQPFRVQRALAAIKATEA